MDGTPLVSLNLDSDVHSPTLHKHSCSFSHDEVDDDDDDDDDDDVRVPSKVTILIPGE